MVDDDTRYNPCTRPGCPRDGGEPTCRDPETRRPICRKHAAELAGGRCQWCGEVFDPDDDPPDVPGYGVYASNEGKAYCITCWEAEGYGYEMRPKDSYRT